MFDTIKFYVRWALWWRKRVILRKYVSIAFGMTRQHIDVAVADYKAHLRREPTRDV